MLVRPDSVQPGDRLTPARGRYQGIPCVVTDIRQGRYSTYDLMVRPLVTPTDRYAVDYTTLVNVERIEETA